MVDESVGRFVCSDSSDYVEEFGGSWESPVILIHIVNHDSSEESMEDSQSRFWEQGHVPTLARDLAQYPQCNGYYDFMSSIAGKLKDGRTMYGPPPPPEHQRTDVPFSASRDTSGRRRYRTSLERRGRGRG